MERPDILRRLDQAQSAVCLCAENVRRQKDLIARLDGSRQADEAERAGMLLVNFEYRLAEYIEDGHRIAQELVDFDRQRQP